MNEITLNGLINLFAVFSAITESDKSDAVKNFSLYIEVHLGISASEEYIALFVELLDFYNVGSNQQTSIDYNKQAVTICKNLRSRLHKTEQVIVFLRFLELAESGNIEKADRLFLTVAEIFGIDQEKLQNLKTFTFHSSNRNLFSPEFLLIDNIKEYQDQEFGHIHNKNLNGEIVFLRSGLLDHLIFRYKGTDDITLEGNPIVPNRFYSFKEGGILRSFKISPIYYSDITSRFLQKESSSPFRYSGKNIEFKFKNSTNGIHPFSFSEQSGQLIAIMGGSGVGKSTLLNLLNGNIPLHKGEIKINNQNLTEIKNTSEGIIGFVPQDDLLFEDLTVWENLYFNAHLCFDKISNEEINYRINIILIDLELFSIKDLKVGSPLNKVVSGGQRKRLNIALELIREPAILFIDEPTSGLASTDSEKVMLLLKQQTRLGKLIFVNIHQPSSAVFKLFDKLWILDKGGKPVYTGNPLDSIIYFKSKVHHINAGHCECAICGNVNPDQVLEILETKKIDSSGNFTKERKFSPEFWYNEFNSKIDDQADDEAISNAKIPDSEFNKPQLVKQFVIFFRRNLRTKLANNQYKIINLFEAPLLAVLVAILTKYSEHSDYIFFENKSLISYLFMSVIVMLFMGMTVSAEEIINDRKVLQRESFLNLSRFSYLNSKILFLIFLSAFQSLTYIIIGNSILEIHGMLFPFWMILFATTVFSNMLGLNISSAFNSVVTIYILIPILLIPQILLCGVVVKFDDLRSKSYDKDAVPVVADLMVSRWAYEALLVEQFCNNKYQALFFDLEKDITQSRYIAEILTTELTGRLDLVFGWQKINKPEHDIESKQKIIRNELSELSTGDSIKMPFDINLLNTKKLNPGNYREAKKYLDDVKNRHSKNSKRLRRIKDKLITHINKLNGKDYLYQLKLHHHNKALETLLLNTKASDYFRETSNGLMQKIAPVYKNADYKNGRAHFLSSEKTISKLNLNTTNFNLLVIWLMIIFLYLALYFEWLRKTINFFSAKK